MQKFKMGAFALLAGVLLAAMIVVGDKLVETNDAGNMQVKQAAITGDLTCQLQPGMYAQMFGSISTYREAETFSFNVDLDNDGNSDSPLLTRFNDGTVATVTGSLRVLLPSNCEDMIMVHRKFHSMEGVMAKLVMPAMRKAMFSTGPHMSASESQAERRGEFASLAEDQLRNGVIMTDQEEREVPDPITGELKKIMVAVKEKCSPEGPTCIGGFNRDPSAFHEYGITVSNFVIDNIEYPSAVLEQIETQRKARMNILTQQAQAKEAEARASKAEAEAKAQIAETRAQEEIAKTQAIVRAEAAKDQAVLEARKKKEVAALDLESADLEKRARILRAEGEATAAAKLIQADGALKQKLDAYVKVQELWAAAYAQQRPTADVVFGGGEGGRASGSSPAETMMQLLSIKAAKELKVTPALDQ